MRKDLLAYLALAAVCIIWGTTYLALRIAVADFPPFLFSAIRQIVAGLILVFVMVVWGKVAIPSKENLMQQAFGGFLMMTLGNGFVAWAEMFIPSGVAAIICSLMPIWVIMINLTINKDERPTLPIIIGVLMGLLGILMIFGEHMADFSRKDYLLGIVMTFIATLSWASGSVWIKKRNLQSNPFMNAGLQMLFGGLFMLPCSLLVDDLSTIRWTTGATYSMIYLIVFGSLIAYTCYSYALRKLPMTIVSLYAYVNPVVAVVLGWLVLDEKLNLRIVSAIVLTVAGIYIVNKGYQLRDLWKAQFSQEQ